MGKKFRHIHLANRFIAIGSITSNFNLNFFYNDHDDRVGGGLEVECPGWNSSTGTRLLKAFDVIIVKKYLTLRLCHPQGVCVFLPAWSREKTWTLYFSVLPPTLIPLCIIYYKLHGGKWRQSRPVMVNVRNTKCLLCYIDYIFSTTSWRGDLTTAKWRYVTSERILPRPKTSRP